MLILGIETSCDETAAAVVRDGRETISNVVFTQIPLHKRYGGVVPEIASRAHIEKIDAVVRAALDEAAEATGGAPLDAVAVTYGPGLAPALIVGLNFAKGLAASLGVPLVAINHLEAHLHTPFLFDAGEAPAAPEPSRLRRALGLVVSGGHTNWIDMPSYGRYRTIGQTLDDAAGEAFDKAAKMLGLGYPGGPVIDKMAAAYNADHPDLSALIPFPKGRPREGVSALAGLRADFCVSFSGLKTALMRYVEREGAEERERIVASYQEAIVQALAGRTEAALRAYRPEAFVLGGGVSLNSRVRSVLGEVCARAGVPLYMAKPKYCGDNGAMVAGLAFYRRNIAGDAAMAVDAAPSLEIADAEQ